MQGDAERLRIGDGDEADDRSRTLAGQSLGTPCAVAATATKTTYPTTAQCFYYMQMCDPFGTETEGQPGTTATVPGAFFYALNLGSTRPAAGTKVICTNTGNRWVFRYDS